MNVLFQVTFLTSLKCSLAAFTTAEATCHAWGEKSNLVSALIDTKGRSHLAELEERLFSLVHPSSCFLQVSFFFSLAKGLNERPTPPGLQESIKMGGPHQPNTERQREKRRKERYERSRSLRLQEDRIPHFARPIVIKGLGPDFLSCPNVFLERGFPAPLLVQKEVLNSRHTKTDKTFHVAGRDHGGTV